MGVSDNSNSKYIISSIIFPNTIPKIVDFNDFEAEDFLSGGGGYYLLCKY